MFALARITAILVVGALLMAGAATAAKTTFTGAWTGVDTDDGSTILVLIGAENASGGVRVTLIDQFASACGAAATALGSGTTSGSTLTGTFDVRCGGELLVTDAPFEFELSGEVLLGEPIEFHRVGKG